jgi:hypothetical protein
MMVDRSRRIAAIERRRKAPEHGRVVIFLPDAMPRPTNTGGASLGVIAAVALPHNYRDPHPALADAQSPERSASGVGNPVFLTEPMTIDHRRPHRDG